MQQFTISSGLRSATGKGPNYQLRKSGKLPAVVYGATVESELITLDYRQFEQTLAKPDARNGLFTLKREDGTDTLAIIREVQRDPVTRRFLHVDFYRIRLDVKGNFDVAIHSVGNPIGVKEGGILETHLRTVTVNCLPLELPSYLEVDISALRVNQSVHVSDLKLADNVAMVTVPGEVLFTVLPPKGEKAVAVDAPAQPEVIGKKKAEEVK
jgi:large subunit ribosomal protein L25